MGRITLVRMTISGSWEGAIVMGTHGREMMGKVLRSLQICQAEQENRGEGATEFRETPEMAGRIKMLVVIVMVKMTMVIVVMMMMTLIVIQVSDSTVYCKSLICELIYFSTICRYSAPTNRALPT